MELGIGIGMCSPKGYGFLAVLVINRVSKLSNNYRPVSLTVASCKVMEHVIYRSIMQHLEHNNILYSKQHGFRRNHSCETQLLLTIEDLGKNLDEGYEVDL